MAISTHVIIITSFRNSYKYKGKGKKQKKKGDKIVFHREHLKTTKICREIHI